MSELHPSELIVELRARASALAKGIHAGTPCAEDNPHATGGIDPRAPEDALRVVGAADRFEVLWLDFLRSDRDPNESLAAQRTRRHDLRTPIGHIIGYLELLAEGFEDVLDPGPDVLAWSAETERLLTQGEALAEAVDRELKHSMPQPSARTSQSRRATAGSRLLVVDDLEENRGLLSRTLARDGHEVLEAASGEEGIERLRTEAPELLLLDIMMPGLDGHATLARIRAHEEWRDLPIIMLSSVDDSDEVARCINAGAQDHLPRPFVPEVLRARVAALLDRKHLLDEQRRQHQELLLAKARIDDFVHYVVPMGARLASQRDTQQLVDDLLEASIRFANASGGSLLLRDHGAHEGEAQWRVVVSRGAGEPSPSLADRAAATLEAFLFAEGVWCLPLQNQIGITTAVLQLRGLPDGETSQQLAPLVSLGSLAAAALERAEYERELRNKIALLEVQVDAAAQQREVAAITETEYFQELRRRATEIRAQKRSADPQAVPRSQANQTAELDE